MKLENKTIGELLSIKDANEFMINHYSENMSLSYKTNNDIDKNIREKYEKCLKLNNLIIKELEKKLEI